MSPELSPPQPCSQTNRVKGVLCVASYAFGT